MASGDWLEGTIHDRKKTQTQIVSETKAYFEALSMEWDELGYGGLGYTHSAKVGENETRVFWSPERLDMGVHVRIPSGGIAEMDVSFDAIVSDFWDKGMKFSRLDIAHDDFEGVLSMDVIEEKCNKRELTLRGKPKGSVTRSLFNESGFTITLGARSSGTYVRIYDKSAEQADKHRGVFTSWIRVEAEYKGDRAHAVAREIVTHYGAWGELASGWLRQHLDFKDEGTPAQKCRWQTCGWWESFLNNASKVQIVIDKAHKSIEDVRRWVDRQVTPSLYLLGKTLGWDELFSDMLKAESRLNPAQQHMLDLWGTA